MAKLTLFHLAGTITKSAVKILVFSYIGILIGLYFSQDSMLFPAPTELSPVPEITGLVKAKIVTRDNETLSGWYVAPKANDPTVLFFHGNGGQINDYGFLAEQFAADGFGFAAIEYRGYPGSTGKVSEAGLMTDGLAAFDWVKQQCNCEITVMAHSLGTGIAVNVAAEREVQAVALFAPYSSIVDIAAARYWFLPVKYLIKNPFHSDQQIGKVIEPVLMVHGRADRDIPIQFGQKLFDLANQPKEFIALDSVGHNEVLSDESVVEVLEFLDGKQP
jgi:uncharacterized protein